jgi:hypothetical protein
MDKLHTWLQAQFDERTVEPNSGLGQAISYLLKHWPKLTLFLEKPLAEKERLWPGGSITRKWPENGAPSETKSDGVFGQARKAAKTFRAGRPTTCRAGLLPSASRSQTKEMVVAVYGRAVATHVSFL